MTTPSNPSLPCICGDPQCLIPFGLCHCGCGEKTILARRTHRRDRKKKGCPGVFIVGHNASHSSPEKSRSGRAGIERQSGRKNLAFRDAQPFKIDSVYCKLIPLTHGFYAIVDASDWDDLAVCSWYAFITKNGLVYACSSRHPGKMMHRKILGLEKGDPREGDHIDPSRTLDNRRKNLRIVSDTEQQYNTRRRKDNSSGFKGVSWDKQHKKYVVQIRTNGKNRRVGFTDDPTRGAEMYREAAESERGEYARTA